MIGIYRNLKGTVRYIRLMYKKSLTRYFYVLSIGTGTGIGYVNGPVHSRYLILSYFTGKLVRIRRYSTVPTGPRKYRYRSRVGNKNGTSSPTHVPVRTCLLINVPVRNLNV